MGTTTGGEELCGTVEAEVVLAGEDEHVLGLLAADGTALGRLAHDSNYTFMGAA